MAVRFPDMPQPVDIKEEVAVIPRYEDFRKLVVGKEGQNPGELSNPLAVAIDENSNHIYVTESRPARVSIFSESGEFLNAFTHEHMKHPYGIAIHRNNVYVSDWMESTECSISK